MEKNNTSKQNQELSLCADEAEIIETYRQLSRQNKPLIFISLHLLLLKQMTQADVSQGPGDTYLHYILFFPDSIFSSCTFLPKNDGDFGLLISLRRDFQSARVFKTGRNAQEPLELVFETHDSSQVQDLKESVILSLGRLPEAEVKVMQAEYDQVIGHL